jgi:hypothetical protein
MQLAGLFLRSVCFMTVQKGLAIITNRVYARNRGLAVISYYFPIRYRVRFLSYYSFRMSLRSARLSV